MKVLFLIEGWITPASRYRVLQYLPYLEEQGIAFTVRALHGESHPPLMRKPLVGKFYKALVRSKRWFQITDAADFDVVFLQRLTLPFTSVIERRLAQINPRIIFDFDDALFQTENGPNEGRMRVFREVVDSADQVLAGSRYLADVARPDSCVIPTVINTGAYRPNGGEEDKLVIGWMGTHSNYPNFEPILVALSRLQKRFPQVHLHIVSDVAPPFTLPGMTYEAWDKDREIADLQAFHIGIMPLTDTSWNRGKCAFKIIEYMSVGIPVVAGRVGANSEVVLEGKTGFLAESAKEWEAALSRLIKDKSLRRRLGKAGRDRCVTHYSIDSQKENFLALLHKVAGEA